jgi:hypothetical protein
MRAPAPSSCTQHLAPKRFGPMPNRDVGCVVNLTKVCYLRFQLYWSVSVRCPTEKWVMR